MLLIELKNGCWYHWPPPSRGSPSPIALESCVFSQTPSIGAETKNKQTNKKPEKGSWASTNSKGLSWQPSEDRYCAFREMGAQGEDGPCLRSPCLRSPSELQEPVRAQVSRCLPSNGARGRGRWAKSLLCADIRKKWCLGETTHRGAPSLSSKEPRALSISPSLGNSPP